MPADDSKHNWFDAHLDLAYLAECGRDMHTGLADCRGRYRPASVTLPTLAEGGVTGCLGTVFTEAVADASAPDAEQGAFAYPTGDALAAYRAGWRQVLLYKAWRDAGLIRFMPRRGQAALADAGQASAPLEFGVLIECADPIERPDDLETWVESGVVAIGMAWWHGGRYAAGNGADPKDMSAGLTDLGRALADRMDELHVTHDLSHLSQRASDELLAHTSAPVIASHSNARALMPGLSARDGQRHLSDETIAEIGGRGGVIGINLYSRFLKAAASDRGSKDRATPADVARHAEHIAQAAGGRDRVGLGSDADGGFGADRLPEGIGHPRDYEKLADALRDVGWSDAEIEGFRGGNWRRFWRGG
ncbi:MAG: membrane dipeptidase [Planctomycetota bacterium]